MKLVHRIYFRNSRSFGWLAAVVLSAILAGSGCKKPVSKSAIRIAVHSGPVTLDPHAHNEVGTFAILRNIYDSLVVFDDQLQIRPLLADSWSNPDETTWQFHLRADARFADGSPVTSADVVASIERARTRPDSMLASYLVEVASVEPAGPHQVVIKTRRSFPALLNKLAFVFILPKGTVTAGPGAAGSGPYVIESWQKGDPLWLEPVPRHWGGREAVLRLLIVPIGDAKERTDRLLRGEVDIAQDLLPEDFDRVQQQADLRGVSVVSSVVEYLHLSATDPLFSDPRVRQAIDLALDRDVLVQQITKGHGQPASQLVGAGVFGYDPSLPVTKRDLVRAKALLREAGHPNGFAVTLEYRHGRTGVEIARQLGEAGIQVTVKASDFSDIFQRLARREVLFYLGGISAPTVDASDIFDAFAHSGSGVYGRSNFNGYSNPHLDKLAYEVSSVRELTRRREMLQETMRTLVADRYHLPLYVPYDLYGLRKEIDWEPHLDRTLSGWEMRRR
jgi:peptide/nickel transport system substrate-binding protein